MSKLVSILIPNYNKAPYLRLTLDSILAQTYTNWECIVVDDHSTDNSWEILEEYAGKDTRFNMHKRPKRLVKGGNVCRNYAFSLAKGDFIQWFDSDDTFCIDALKERVGYLNDTKADFIISHGMFADGNSMESLGLLISPIMYKNYVESFYRLDSPYLPQSILCRADFIRANSISWDESLSTIQDVNYSLELYLNSSKVKIIPCLPDWKWRRITDASNVGGLGRRKEAIPSYINFITKMSNYNNYNYLLRGTIFLIFNRYEKKNPPSLFSGFLLRLYRRGNIGFRDLFLFTTLFLLRLIPRGYRIRLGIGGFEKLVMKYLMTLSGVSTYDIKYGMATIKDLRVWIQSYPDQIRRMG